MHRNLEIFLAYFVFAALFTAYTLNDDYAHTMQRCEKKHSHEVCFQQLNGN